ncbi:MAG: glycosyltransferase family 4 protein [Candidatus Gastranaerophilales bacterium]|nr:glycosyltransferase family 4 protein [Candidatus Gastranaerophilales bacterium]
MKNENEVLMIGPEAQGGISSVIGLYKDYGLNVINLASYKKNNIFFQMIFYPFFIFQYIITLLTNKNIKLVHIHNASRGSFLRKIFVFNIAKIFRKKVIIHIHGAEFDLFYNKSPDLIKKLITNTLNQADLIIVLSQEWKSKITDICSNKNIKILYNPTIIKDIQHIKSDYVNFLFMGRLGKRKGTYDIIEAAKYIKNPNVIINLYGDGDIEEFQNLINDNNLQDKVKIRGWISGDKKEEVYGDSDILLLPSYNEGLPMSILEAMAHGLSIISTPVGGIPEAVEDGTNGFLIQPGDYKALAEKIDLLASDTSLREKMGSESYNIAKEKFDIKIIIKELQEIYDELLK